VLPRSTKQHIEQLDKLNSCITTESRGNVTRKLAVLYCSHRYGFADVAADLSDELVELRTVPVALNVGVRLAEVNVEHLSEDHAHWALGRPRHRLQQQRNYRLLYRVSQTHLAPVIRSATHRVAQKSKPQSFVHIFAKY